MSMMTGMVDAETMRARWTWFVGFGVAFAILGVIALANAVDATLVTTVIIGFLMIAAGIVQLVGAFASGQSTGGRILAVVLGLLYLIVGFEVVADPIQGAIALTVVIALLLIIGGVFRIVGSIAERGSGWVLGLAVGIINILLGLWLWSGIPFTGVAIGVFVGIDLLLGGILWIVLGLAARSGPAGTATA